MEIEETIDPGMKELVDIINKCPRFSTVACCEGHPFEPSRGDYAFVTFELTEKDMKDYEFFHKLLSFGVNVSFGHENRVIISHPWRQYGQLPARKEKANLNKMFIKNAQKAFSDLIKGD
ncbi:hypothetical protein COX84_01220, partial [Candidatus Micrarchaeota archaeon CG_4_10_14_0_2_um_filter_49_7]